MVLTAPDIDHEQFNQQFKGELQTLAKHLTVYVSSNDRALLVSRLVNLVDVTPVNRTRNFHNFSLETPEFFNDLYLRLTNPELPRSRPIYHIKTPDGVVYSVLTRGR